MKSEDIARYVAGLEGEVERLRAAQPALPDVGPVTRNEHGLLTCGPEADWYCHITSPDRLRLFAARYLAVADHLDAEAPAADTSSSGMRVEKDRDQYRVYCDGLDPSGRPVALVPAGFHNDGRSVAQHVADAVEAHRAARTSEGGAA